MSNKLKKSDLLKMILDLQERIRVLESRPYVSFPPPIKPDETIIIPSIWPLTTQHYGCVDGQPHDYPTPWHGVVPPSCRKCGKPGETYTITCLSDSKLPDSDLK